MLEGEKNALEKNYGQAVWALMQIMLLEGRGSAEAARNIAHHTLCRILPREVRKALSAEIRTSGWLADIPTLESSDAAQE